MKQTNTLPKNKTKNRGNKLGKRERERGERQPETSERPSYARQKQLDTAKEKKAQQRLL
jgi:hypothetical protein